MKKETVIAIIFGIVFGSIVALIILAKNKEIQLTKAKTLTPTEKVAQITKNTNTSVQQFKISEPQDGEIVGENKVTIKGKAEKDSLIVIQSPSQDLIFKNTKEDFSVSLNLANGDNSIKITMYPKVVQARSQEKNLHIYYLSETL